MGGSGRNVARVPASPGDIRRSYTTLSRIYAIIERVFEKGLRQRGLELLAAVPGEVILEIGVGTGYALKEIGAAVGPGGRACGLDITPRMLELTGKRLRRAGLNDRVDLFEGDARKIPFADGKFEAVYMAGTLELFDTPDIPEVLGEIRRVLKPGGRLCVASLTREGRENSLFVRIYELLHRIFPGYASCRPIYVEDSVKEAGYRINKSQEYLLYGFTPWRIVVAVPEVDS